MRTFSFFLAAVCAACANFVAVAEKQEQTPPAVEQNQPEIAADPGLSAEFAALCAHKAEAGAPDDAARQAQNAPQQAAVVEGADGWLFSADELAQIGSVADYAVAIEAVGEAEQPFVKPMSAILRYRKQLDKQGIKLIVVPVPAKALVYPDKFSPELFDQNAVPRLDAPYARFYEELSAKGVTVVDLLPALLAARAAEAEPLYHRQDSRLSSAGCMIAARQIADLMEAEPWYQEAHKFNYVTQQETVERLGTLARQLEEKPDPEKLAVRQIGEKHGGLIAPVRPRNASPVILLGTDGIVQSPKLNEAGAGLFDQMTYELGFPPALFLGADVNAARYTLYKRMRQEAKLLKEKKVLIWCFDTGELTATEWRPVGLR